MLSWVSEILNSEQEMLCTYTLLVAAIGAGDVQPREMPGHNASLAILGVFILWFGWYGFNPGSALALLGVGDVVAISAINTTLSAATGTLSALAVLMFLEFMDSGHVVYDLIGASNGTLGGLVGITSACSVVEVQILLLVGLYWCNKSVPFEHCSFLYPVHASCLFVLSS